jgi:hypothetical protein
MLIRMLPPMAVSRCSAPAIQAWLARVESQPRFLRMPSQAAA